MLDRLTKWLLADKLVRCRNLDGAGQLQILVR
jgi:hypothetical protein